MFENFRKTCLKQYGLDPVHYYTSPGLSWDALLKHSNICLELLTDYDMHLFIGLIEGIDDVPSDVTATPKHHVSARRCAHASCFA